MISKGQRVNSEDGTSAEDTEAMDPKRGILTLIQSSSTSKHNVFVLVFKTTRRFPLVIPQPLQTEIWPRQGSPFLVERELH